LKAACTALSPGCGVVGGDLAASDQIMISVAAHGSLEGREPVLRSGAQVGDIVAVAGTLGRAAAGLALLESANRDAISAYDDLVNIQRRPNPPIQSGVAAAIAGATAMLDLSDGLARDAARIAKASSVTIQIDPMHLQGFEAVLEESARAIEANPSDWVIGGGEDHSLLATFPAGATVPRAFKPIGVVLPQGPAPVMLGAQPLPERGWDSSRAASS
jgi:thiamine-monophosphate kinase